MLRNGKPLWLTCLAAICFLLTFVPAQAQYSPDERFLSALRANRLFDLAEEVCRNRLSASKLTPRERVILTVERMLVLTEKGVNAPLAERPAAFDAARKIASDFVIANPDEPRGVLVRFQDALTVLTLGELERLEAELGTASPADIETARNTLREAVKLLEAFDADLQKRIPDARRGPSNKASITAEELTTLRTHVGFQLARAARNQALLYPEKGEDRTASLLRGKRQLEEAVLAIGDEEPLYWLASTELATFSRMLGDLGRADKLLDELHAKNPPVSAIPIIRAEEIRILVAFGKATDGVAQGTKWADSVSPRDADLDLAVLEAIVADSKQSKSADSLMDRLTEMENRHGPYWGRRGSALVLKSAPAGMTGENLDLLSRTADQLFLQKNYDAAITAYDRAAQKAKETKNDAKFVEFTNKAALVEQERKGHSEAVRRFLELAVAPEAKSIAAESHLAAAWNQAQLVAIDAKDTKVFGRYEELLKDQIEKFKGSPTASTAKLWLAKFYLSQGNWNGAQGYAKWIPLDAKESDEGLTICLNDWNRQLARYDDPKDSPLGPALNWAKSVEGDLTKPIQRKIRATALGWSLLNNAEGDHAAAERELHELIEKTPESEPEIISAAKTLLVVALAGQPTKHEEAVKMLAEAGGTPKQKLTSIMGLVKIMKSDPPFKKSPGSEIRKPLAAFVLDAIEKMTPQLANLSESEKTLVDLAFADALLAKGDAEKANAAFLALAKKQPNSAAVQEAFALFLSQASQPIGPGGISGEPAIGSEFKSLGIKPSQALDQWRLVASRSEPKSDRWYRAKYYVAKTQFQMGQKTEAAKLIDYLDALPPGLKGAPLEAEFRELRKQCGTETQK